MGLTFLYSIVTNVAFPWATAIYYGIMSKFLSGFVSNIVSFFKRDEKKQEIQTVAKAFTEQSLVWSQKNAKSLALIDAVFQSKCEEEFAIRTKGIVLNSSQVNENCSLSTQPSGILFFVLHRNQCLGNAVVPQTIW